MQGWYIQYIYINLSIYTNGMSKEPPLPFKLDWSFMDVLSSINWHTKNNARIW